MGYINSIAYVQRKIDTIFCEVREWAQAYINDIVCDTTFVSELLAKLWILFNIFVNYNISIKPTKTFFNYPNIGLLGQRVNSLGLTTAEDKLRAIQLLCYPDILEALVYYLGLIGYLRSYVHYYTQLAEPLQSLKTMLLKSVPVSGTQKRSFTSKTKFPIPTLFEEGSFLSLQESLYRPSTLIHYNPNRDLWIDLDRLKEFGFGTMLFHVKKRILVKEGKWPLRSEVEPLLFLSRLLTPAKRNYWPTELEIARFVWIVKKKKPMIESTRTKIIIQTDHSSILDIMQQSSIISTPSTMKMNVWLVRIFEFLWEFQLTVCHKPGKEHMVLDVLNRLASANTNLPSNLDHSELDFLFAYTTTLIQLKPTLFQKIISGYQKDEWWQKILKQVDDNDCLSDNKVTLLFERGNRAPTDADPYFSPRPHSDLFEESTPQGSNIANSSPMSP